MMSLKYKGKYNKELCIVLLGGSTARDQMKLENFNIGALMITRKS
jgi:hypothetical protein